MYRKLVYSGMFAFACIAVLVRPSLAQVSDVLDVPIIQSDELNLPEDGTLVSDETPIDDPVTTDTTSGNGAKCGEDYLVCFFGNPGGDEGCQTAYWECRNKKGIDGGTKILKNGIKWLLH